VHHAIGFLGLSNSLGRRRRFLIINHVGKHFRKLVGLSPADHSVGQEHTGLTLRTGFLQYHCLGLIRIRESDVRDLGQ